MKSIEASEPPAGRSSRRRSPAGLLALAAIFALGAWGISEAIALVRADLTVLEARAMAVAWADGERWTLPDWQDARDQFLAGLAITPDNPVLLDYLASLYVLRGHQARSDAGLKREFFGQALAWQRRSLALRPAHGVAWANLALIEHELAPGSAAEWAAWSEARALAPYEPPSERIRADLALADWNLAPPPVRAWLGDYYSRTWPNERLRLGAFARSWGRENLLPPRNEGSSSPRRGLTVQP